jgi:hypothetical protein
VSLADGLADSDPVMLKQYKAKAYKNMDYHENPQIYDITGLAIYQLGTNWSTGRN